MIYEFLPPDAISDGISQKGFQLLYRRVENASNPMIAFGEIPNSELRTPLTKCAQRYSELTFNSGKLPNSLFLVRSLEMTLTIIAI